MKNDKTFEKIWNTVPPNYYQQGVKKKILQRLWHFGKLKAVVSLMKKNHRKVLDVGCASGWFLSQIAKKYPKAECFGIDIYKKAINYGKKRYRNLKLIYADAHNLPFENKMFDVIICTEVLEHVLEPKKVLKEIKRVLSKEGTAIIEMDSGNILFNLIWFWWTHARRGVWKDAHIHTFNTKKLEKMIQESGFKIIKKKIFNFSMAIVIQLNIDYEKVKKS